MTISTETVFKRYAGNGATVGFAFPYHFFENGDLLVYLELLSSGVATLQTLDTHYTVSGADDPSGGTVTFLSAPSALYTVVIFRKPDLTQTASLSSFSAVVINDALDRLYEHLQYFEWVRSRTVRLPDTMAAATLDIPFDRAEQVLGFDASGDVTMYPAADAIAAQAAQDAAEAAAGVAVVAAQNPAIAFLFLAGTADANPGTGKFSFNHATLASVTQIFLCNTALDGNNVSAWLDSIDDNNNTANRGYIVIKGTLTPQAILVGKITGTVVDGTGYRKLTVTVISSGGTFTSTEPFSVFFTMTGSDGEVTGPASATDGHAVLFNGTTGKAIKSAGFAPANAATLSSHLADTGNPHSVTKTQVGLSAVTNDAQLKVASNLSDVNSAATSFGNIKQNATNAATGVVEHATDAEIRAATTGNLVVIPSLIESASALVALTDAAPVTVDWDAGINFSLTVTAARQIDNPTNGQPGTYRSILVQGNNTTDRTITWGANYLGDVPVVTDCDDGRWYLFTIMCITTSHFVVSSKKAKGT